MISFPCWNVGPYYLKIDVCYNRFVFGNKYLLSRGQVSRIYYRCTQFSDDVERLFEKGTYEGIIPTESAI